MSDSSVRDFIRQKYKASGMGQREIAQKAGITQQSLHRYLAGGQARTGTADALLRVFGYELHHKRLVKKK